MASKSIKPQIIEEINFFREYPQFPNLVPPSSGNVKPGKVDPVAKAQFNALVVAFEERSSSLDHMRAIARRLQQTMTFCPKPPDVHAAADYVAAQHGLAEYTGKPPVCPHGECDGSGFISTKLTVENVNVAGFCRCHAAYTGPRKGAARATSSR